jgi:nucleoside-diphosphate-sugar epimerase
MIENELIACVTGASGMIGQRIARKLLQKGCAVRVLARDRNPSISGVQVFHGSLSDEKILSSFLRGGHFVFHCAAELKDEQMMWEINARGTERLFRIAGQSGIRYFCHLSSVGVTGLTDSMVVDETTPCSPQNAYEKSKLAAETIVAEGIDGCRVVILRPTNVIDERHPGALALPIRGGMSDRVTLFLKGGECAHIVHAEDVADASIHFIDNGFEQPECYIISCDHEEGNTYAALWGLYRKICLGNMICDSSTFHMPVTIPHLLRRLKGCRSNRGDIRYSSKKLLSTGFMFSLGIEGAVREIATSLEDLCP